MGSGHAHWDQADGHEGGAWGQGGHKDGGGEKKGGVEEVPRDARIEPAHMTARRRGDGRHNAIEGEDGAEGGVADGKSLLHEDCEVLSEEEGSKGQEET